MNANERSGEKGSRRPQSPKKAQPNRSKIRMTVWWTSENYHWLKENISNVSHFLNKVIDELKNQIEPRLILITPKTHSIFQAGVAESGKGAGLKTLSRRGPGVQIPPPAWFYFEDLHFKRLLCSYLLLQISDF